jgi:hypothetical protein
MQLPAELQTPPTTICDNRALADRRFAIGARLISQYPIICRVGYVDLGGAEMRSFIGACVAAIVIAAVGAFVLNFYQESVHTAYVTESVRI